MADNLRADSLIKRTTDRTLIKNLLIKNCVWSIGRCGVSSGDGMSDVGGRGDIEGVGKMECKKVEGIGISCEAVAV
jgi:hypothetical protein